MKRCWNCKQRKPLTDFHKDGSRGDGLACRCKICCAKYGRSSAGRASDRKRRQNPAHKATKAVYDKARCQIPTVKKAREKQRKTCRETLRGYLHLRWSTIKQRCENPNDTNYPRYGGRGICCLFVDFDDFYEHVTIDLKLNSVTKIRGKGTHRIDNGNYERGNIEFLTPAEHGLRHRELNREVA